jgi:putative tryptophan/tyrosine transport system substrate-binding protein
MAHLARREFIGLLGGVAATWPFAAQGQQPSLPVIGFLDRRSPEALGDRLRAFRLGLRDVGYVEGENVLVEYRWADNRIEMLPALAAELVRRPVAVMVASGGIPVILRAQAATTRVPVVFLASQDPVALGLVASLARPGGNLTGVNFFNAELTGKRWELLRELLPAATRLAVLVNPDNAPNTESTLRELEPAAAAMGQEIRFFKANSSREIDSAFEALVREKPQAVFVAGDGLFESRRVQLVQLAAHHRIPAVYSGREYAEVGGLMSYASDITNAYRQVGIYTGRILKGAKPADLPVVQAAKFELVINHQTARMLGLSVPSTLLARADEVIE